MGDHSRINWVGLGSFAERLGEGAHLRGIDYHHRQACAGQARRDHRLEAAGSLDRHHLRRQGFEPDDEVFDSYACTLEDKTLAGRTNRHVQAIL